MRIKRRLTRTVQPSFIRKLDFPFKVVLVRYEYVKRTKEKKKSWTLMTLIRRKGCLVCESKHRLDAEHTFTNDFTVAASRIPEPFGYSFGFDSSKSSIVPARFTRSRGKLDRARGRNHNFKKSLASSRSYLESKMYFRGLDWYRSVGVTFGETWKNRWQTFRQAFV